jgi:hypothetical protein
MEVIYMVLRFCFLAFLLFFGCVPDFERDSLNDPGSNNYYNSTIQQSSSDGSAQPASSSSAEGTQLSYSSGSSVFEPRIEGELAINADYKEGSNLYYYIGTPPSITDHIEITNKDIAECGEVEYELNGDADRAGNVIEAVASAACKGEKKELARITAMVVQDPMLSECVLNSAEIVMAQGIAYMHEDQNLEARVEIINNYGRCLEIVQYSLNGENPTGSLSLKDFANQQLTAEAIVYCQGEEIKQTCPEIFVTYYKNIAGGCERDTRKFTFNSGRTILEFACEEEKSLNDLGDSYYINCEGEGYNHNFEVIVEGGSVEGGGSHNGWNFYPGLQTIKEGTLNRYPVPALITTFVAGDLRCGIW